MKMNLEERSNHIFIEIISNPQITSKALCEKFDLSRGQLNYSLKKINESLLVEKFNGIRRTKTGRFLIDDEIINKFKGGVKSYEEMTNDYILSAKERVGIIKLILLSREEYFSLNHFIDELRVSRNTVLRDLREVSKELQSSELKLVYTRQDGYYIEGNEWNKRNVLSDLLSNLVVMFNGINFIVHFAKLETEQIQIFRNRLELVEEELQVQFTDERLKTLPMLILIIVKRVRKGNVISYNFKINYGELANTKEYLAAERVIWDVDYLSENERVYLTMLLLTTNLSSSNVLSLKEIEKMKEALNNVIENFERIAGVVLKDKKKLLNRLLIHMCPAYYRITYHLNLQTRFYQENKDADLFSLFYLVKEASKPLEAYFNQTIPDVELFFIALFIGSHIFDNATIPQLEKRKRAIIVCPNGISISALLENSLKKLLPEVHFCETISAREFYKKEYDVDFVFSVVPLETDKKVFIVNNFLSKSEKKQLRERVLHSSLMVQTDPITPERILSIVKKHATLVDELNLYDALQNLFLPKETKILKKRHPHLVDLLKEETIQIFEESIDWADVLDELAKPLEHQKIITSEYIKTLKREMPILPTHIVLREKIALPHTAPESGALSVGISLGLIKRGIPVEKGKNIHVVILLGSNNKEEHLELIFEMLNLAGSDEIAELEKAKTKNEILEVLVRFNDRYWRTK